MSAYTYHTYLYYIHNTMYTIYIYIYIYTYTYNLYIYIHTHTLYIYITYTYTIYLHINLTALQINQEFQVCEIFHSSLSMEENQRKWVQLPAKP